MAEIEKIQSAITALEQVDKINEIIDNLGSSTGGGLLLGQIISSLDPLNDARLHLFDGALLPVGGVYDDFITNYIIPLHNSNPSRFITETEWQSQISEYGVCGKYVYTEGVSVRLPKVTGLIEGTLDSTALGDVIPAGLPNITGSFTGAKEVRLASSTGAITLSDKGGSGQGSQSGSDYHTANFDASLSNPIYGGSDTVQPQTVKGYIYIVVATANTQIDDATTNINNIITDLNGKADVDLSNCTNSKFVDGEWVEKYAKLSSNIAVGAHTIDMSEYLPNDGYQYEVMFCIVSHRTSSSASARYITSDVITSNIITSYKCGSLASHSGVSSNASFINLPVGSARYIIDHIELQAQTNSEETGVHAWGYRRLGTNK